MPSANRARYRPMRHPLLGDREWLYERYVVQQMGPRAMAQEAGCKTDTAVLRALGLAGIPVRGRHGVKRGWEPTKEELLTAYTEAGSLQGLADQRGVSLGTIRNVFSRLGLRAADFEPQRAAYVRYPQLLDRDRLEKELYEKITSQIAAELGCRTKLVADAAREHGLKATSSGHPQSVRDEAIKLYSEGVPLHAVAVFVRADQSAVWRWLRAAGVDTTRRRGWGLR